MDIKILGSSSSGNCYILKGKEETLIIEAGVNIKDIIKGVGFQLKGVVGCLVTHEHGDHCKSAKKLADAGIYIYSTQGTFDGMGVNHHRFKPIKKLEKFNVGNFEIIAFGVRHDVNDPVGYLIKHEELGTLLFATDTFYLKYKFPGVNHFLIECNYSEEILAENIKNGVLHHKQAERVRHSHFGLKNVIEFLKVNDLHQAYNIILLHLSNANSHAENFKKTIREETSVETFIASPGAEIGLKNNPF